MVIVKNKYNGNVVEEIPDTTPEQARSILKKSISAFGEMSHLPAHRRSEFLAEASRVLLSRENEMGKIIAQEAGKPIKYARKEVRRASFTIKSSGEEAKRIHGETVPFDVEPRGEGRFAYYIRVPVGPVFSITPFNDPLNLVAHKVGPALASGDSIVNKPTTISPLSSIRLGEIIEEAGAPENAFQNVISGGDSEVTRFFLKREEIKKVTITGGFPAAEKMVSFAGPKKYSMELGSNSPVIVFPDGPWMENIDSIVDAAFESQGQNCIHSQRILIHDSIYEEFLNSFLTETSKLKMGDPLDEGTDMGPMISEGEAKRVENWVNDAAERGASIRIGGKRSGVMYSPTVLDNVDRDSPIWQNEVFGPVTIFRKFHDFKEAIELANEVQYGLQAGVFTSNLDTANKAINSLDYGAVLINDTSDFRVDTMPFGGMKRSGIGREGIRFAIEEMTEIKLAIFKV